MTVAMKAEGPVTASPRKAATSGCRQRKEKNVPQAKISTAATPHRAQSVDVSAALGNDEANNRDRGQAAAQKATRLAAGKRSFERKTRRGETGRRRKRPKVPDSCSIANSTPVQPPAYRAARISDAPKSGQSGCGCA